MLAAVAAAQNSPSKKNLVVNGHTVDAAVIQIEGHSYVDLDAFARTMNATVSFEPGRVLLTVPATAPAAQSAPAPGLSKEFVQAGIAQVAAMQEWKGAIASANRFGLAGGTWLAPWLQDYRSRAEASMNQASAAASSGADQKALQLLKNEFAYLGEWDSSTQATIHSLNAEQAVNPAATQDDPQLTKISACGAFLTGMLVSGEFKGSVSCH
jgi:hypothetical protein